MTDEKFILTSLDDENSKAIAEVLGNKTCKKIMDYLADVNEASEQDIAKAISIPINTAEYNLNKLIKSGLVEKTKNFFWSVKGKKIPMYKLARKHIIISPRSRKPDMNLLKTILPVIGVALILVLAAIYLIPNNPQINNSNDLKQFNSQTELNDFLEKNAEIQSTGFFDGLTRGFGGMKATTGINLMETADSSGAPNAAPQAAGVSDESSSSSSYSTTNIQVEGVDEADIVKNDGKYIYVVSGSRIIIVDAYPAENMQILSELNVSGVFDIYINRDKLIVLANEYGNYGSESFLTKSISEVACLGCGSSSRIVVYTYDISDKENPILENNASIEGNYVNSRMIGDYVYLITTKYINSYDPHPPLYEINGVKNEVSASEVYYFDYEDSSYVFTNIMAVNIENGEINHKVYLTGGASTIYVSEDNIYLTYNKHISQKDYIDKQIREVYLEILPNKGEINKILNSDKKPYEKLSEVQEIFNDYLKEMQGQDVTEFSDKYNSLNKEFESRISKENEKTAIHKIGIDKLDIEYAGVGEVPGTILNQFSMDEYKENFRIATTSGESWSGTSLNNVYILDEDLEIIGKVEDLAKGERIYSARFMGDRGYLVTFKSVDPLFVIDLKDSENPQVLGYLKIPGYSDYLHPYDENHVIGIGKDVDESIDADKVHSEGAVYYTAIKGVKVSLFDVTDVENPIEEAKYVIGDRGTESSVLYDPKALLFDKEKGILVIPVSVAELKPSYWDSRYLNPVTVWQGAYVLNINLDGISSRGKITHNKDIKPDETGYINFPYSSQIQRSLYMDNVLYTISLGKIKANDLNTLKEINEVDLGYTENYYPYYY
ncbi:MAG: beta-propeller domain-containing protein [Candidatus Pacearchaeota archaeon]